MLLYLRCFRYFLLTAAVAYGICAVVTILEGGVWALVGAGALYVAIQFWKEVKRTPIMIKE